jgi:hypothetical protein
MAQLNQHFDASTVEPAAPRDLLPPGRYTPQPVVAVIDVSSVELKEERLARLAKEKAERLPRRSASAKLTQARR